MLLKLFRPISLFKCICQTNATLWLALAIESTTNLLRRIINYSIFIVPFTFNVFLLFSVVGGVESSTISSKRACFCSQNDDNTIFITPKIEYMTFFR